jgi:hypothetical protein
MTEDWEISYPTVTSDHKIMSVKIAHTEAPHLGKGRWAMPQHLTNNRALMREIEEKGNEMLTQTMEIVNGLRERIPNYNPQTLWAKWKTNVITRAREKAKKKSSYLEKREKAIKKEIKKRNNNGSEESPEKRKTIADLEQQRVEIELEKALSRKKISTAQYRLEGETISNYWIRLNKTPKPRDTLKKLRKPPTNEPNNNEPCRYETKSKHMAELARNYHNNLQNSDINPNETEEM